MPFGGVPRERDARRSRSSERRSVGVDAPCPFAPIAPDVIKSVGTSSIVTSGAFRTNMR